MPKRLRVLVVDDDPLVRNLLRAVLQSGEYALDEAKDGFEAIGLASANPPDIVLLDVMMPGANGYDVCRAFRADPALAGAHIVMLTAKSGDEDREAGFAAGADGFFTKPFSPLELMETLEGVKGALR